MLRVLAGEVFYGIEYVSEMILIAKRGGEFSRTFGIAYTKLPNGADVEGSGDVVVRNMRSEVPVFVSWT